MVANAALITAINLVLCLVDIKYYSFYGGSVLGAWAMVLFGYFDYRWGKYLALIFILLSTPALATDLCRVERYLLKPDGTQERIVTCPANTVSQHTIPNQRKQMERDTTSINHSRLDSIQRTGPQQVINLERMIPRPIHNPVLPR